MTRDIISFMGKKNKDAKYNRCYECGFYGRKKFEIGFVYTADGKHKRYACIECVFNFKTEQELMQLL